MAGAKMFMATRCLGDGPHAFDGADDEHGDVFRVDVIAPLADRLRLAHAFDQAALPLEEDVEQRLLKDRVAAGQLLHQVGEGAAQFQHVLIDRVGMGVDVVDSRLQWPFRFQHRLPTCLDPGPNDFVDDR
ncbi:MAG: hypothetical protein CMP06_01725 [Xanthomonadales bacterium]|nr:hypothetical protein [Xanthomonadales bacterium]